MIVVGIDPGTGKSSPTGLAVIDPDTREIISVEAIRPILKLPALHYKLRNLSEQLAIVFSRVAERGEEFCIVGCETFVMRGKGGETLHRLIGAYMATTPHEFLFVEVYNTTVKKIVAGRGDADKELVGSGVVNWFKENKESQQIAIELLNKKQYDQLDALAIAISAFETEVERLSSL